MAITDWPSFHDQRSLAMALSSGPYKAQTAVEVAHQWYVGICIETTLRDDYGAEIRLKGGVPICACETDLKVTPPCELSSPSFARCVTFSELPPQFFSLWVQL